MPLLLVPYLSTVLRLRAFQRAVVVNACALLASSLTLASCAAHRSSTRTAPPQAASVPTPVETRIGVVRVIGAGQRFVLIETPSALATSALSEGELLHCRPADAPTRAATADLRVSRERHQALVVANVVAGEPVVGAVVYAAPPSSPAASPATGSISSVATAPLPGLATPRRP